MVLLRFLFSFQGRIGRAAYGIGTSIPLAVGSFLLVTLVDFGSIWADLQMQRVPEISQSAVAYVTAFWLLSMLSCSALGVKRLHDLNYSGWTLLAPLGLSLLAIFLLATMSPFCILASLSAGAYSVWLMVRMIFFAGTEGDNDYGPPASLASDLVVRRAVVEREPDWVANAVKRTTARAEVLTTPVTRVARTAKLTPAPSGPTGFGRRGRTA
jgi:uncharacterized membrane protein YhaH (DUF805 family)